MGNSSSSSSSKACHSASYIQTDGISGPVPLKGNLKGDSSSYHGLTRRASSVNPSLAPAAGAHRRSKSAMATAQRIPSQAPPSYSEALTNPNGFLAVSGQAPQTASSSGNRLNPFRQLSSNRTVPRPSVGSSSTFYSTDKADHAGGYGYSTPKWTTEAEKFEYLRKPMRQESYEDALEVLRQYNTVIIVDDSGSMTRDNRWQEARNALAALAEAAAGYDADGIDVYFLNNKKEGRNMKSSAQVQRLFDSVSPGGVTPIGAKLNRLLRDYIDSLDTAKRSKGTEDGIRPVNFIVLTDGAATDDPADVIVYASRRLDKGDYLMAQVGIQFVQVGNDKYATEFLRQLDDDLADRASVRDIVDTTPYLGGPLSAETIIKILLGGINRRVDRKGAGIIMRN